MARLFKGTAKNKKTTIAGILTALVAITNAAIALINGQQPDWTVTIASVTVALGLLFAADGE